MILIFLQSTIDLTRPQALMLLDALIGLSDSREPDADYEAKYGGDNMEPAMLKAMRSDILSYPVMPYGGDNFLLLMGEKLYNGYITNLAPRFGRP